MEEEQTVEGVLYKINHCVDGFFIGHLDTGCGVKGNMRAPQVGMFYAFTGRIVHSPQWGDTMHFDTFTTRYPSGIGAIRRYLTENCEYIGPSISLALVTTYGDETLRICKEDPKRVAREVTGLTLDRARRVSQMLLDNERQEALQLALNEIFHGVRCPRRVINQIAEEFDAESPAMIRKDPYYLIELFRGYGWQTADTIATKLGYDPQGMPRVRAAIRHTINTQSQSFGHTALPEADLVDKTHALLGTVVPLEKVLEGIQVGLREGTEIRRDGLISTDKIYEKERELAEMILKLLDAEPVTAPGFAPEGELYQDQLDAFEKMVGANVSILTGPAGSGKSFVIKHLINAFPPGTPIALAAPTGKAAKRMFELSGSEAVTIHRLLEPMRTKKGFRFTRGGDNPLDDKVVVIDESSMLSLHLAHSLLSALKRGSRLVLVGDVHQLPSIGAGNVLRDCIRSGVVPTAELTTIKRQHPGLLVRNSHAIKAGEDITTENENLDGDFFFFTCGSEERIIETIVNLVTEKIPARFGYDPLMDVQVISPMREKTLLGCKNLNAVLQEALNKNPKNGKLRFRVGDKVIQTMNDYDRDIVNGDIGIITQIERKPKQRIQIEFTLPDRLVYVPLIENSLELAYAITIHKAQGGESPVIIIPVHKCLSPLVTQRSLLYTAVTRAKNLCILVGQSAEVAQIIRRTRQQNRHTRLEKMLYDGSGIEAVF